MTPAVTPTITLDTEVVAGLVAHALNALDGWEEPEDPDGGCCPYCCAPCASLRVLAYTGRLSVAVRPWVETSGGDVEWWKDGQVDPGWLRRAWRETSCHNPLYFFGPNDEEYTADVHVEDGVLWGQVREHPGCFSSGRDLDELREALAEAVRMAARDGG